MVKTFISSSLLNVSVSPTPISFNSIWAPISFPAAQPGVPPAAHQAFVGLQAPEVTAGEFYSPKTLQGKSEADFPLLEASSLFAWQNRPFVAELEVSKENLNFLGSVFGGNVAHWHMQAALSMAHKQLEESSDLTSLRLAGGAVRFAAPLYLGDHVRIFAERVSALPGSLLRDSPYSSSYKVQLIARRKDGFDRWPLSVLEVGSSEIEIKHIPVRARDSSSIKSLRGLNITGIIGNALNVCEASSFDDTDFREGASKRAAQIVAAADIGFYLAAQNLGERSKKQPVIVTSDISFEILAEAYHPDVTREPLVLSNLVCSGRQKRGGKEFFKLAAEVCAGSKRLASSSATMVRLQA